MKRGPSRRAGCVRQPSRRGPCGPRATTVRPCQIFIGPTASAPRLVALPSLSAAHLVGHPLPPRSSGPFQSPLLGPTRGHSRTTAHTPSGCRAVPPPARSRPMVVRRGACDPLRPPLPRATPWGPPRPGRPHRGGVGIAGTSRLPGPPSQSPRPEDSEGGPAQPRR